jgi:Rrf2 family transcriptional regulator, iron-sulfur cluster assembly transcription factor
MLSNTSKYAIRATIYLAAHVNENEKIGIKRISEDLGIPTPFLGKILQSLARNKILSSTKGPNGGFGMGKNPSEISLLEIIETIDNSDFLHVCVIGSKNCVDTKIKCSLHANYSRVRDEFREMLKNETIENLVSDFRKGKQRISI